MTDLAQALNDTNHPLIRDALTRPCDICGAPSGAKCQPRQGIHHDLAGRRIHLARMHKP